MGQLVTCYGIQPRFLHNPGGVAAGVGGEVKVLAICQMPHGIAGINGISTWMVLDESEIYGIPALFSIGLMSIYDMSHKINGAKVTIGTHTLNGEAVSTTLRVLPSKHQAIDLCALVREAGICRRQ